MKLGTLENPNGKSGDKMELLDAVACLICLICLYGLAMFLWSFSGSNADENEHI